MIIESGIHEPLNAVSCTTAEMIANSIMSDDAIIPTRSEGYKVKDYFSIPAEDGSDLIHVFNYEGGGFVLIAGDNRLEPVLAYSASNAFNSQIIEDVSGLKYWIDCIDSKIAYCKKNNISQEETIKAMWDSNMGIVLTRSLDPESGVDPECDTIVGPLVIDSWHQYADYNQNLTDAIHVNLFTNSTFLHKPVIGCVPLSIARILHYWSTPSNYPWSSMSNTTPDQYNKALLNDVHYYVKFYAEANGYSFGYTYNPNASGVYQYATGVDTSFPIDLFLTELYGFSSASMINYNSTQYSIIRREIFDYQRPVILEGRISDSGGGHAWICDGYRYKFEHWYDSEMNIIGVPSNWMSEKWGLNNSENDGWYSATYFQPFNDGVPYNYNMLLTYEIEPY